MDATVVAIVGMDRYPLERVSNLSQERFLNGKNPRKNRFRMGS